MGPNINTNLATPLFEPIIPGLTNPVRALYPSMSINKFNSALNSWTNTNVSSGLTSSNVGIGNFLAKNVVAGLT